MEKNIFIVNIPRNPNDKQVYMQSFCEAWLACGGKAVEQSKWMRFRLVRHLLKGLALCRFSCRDPKRVYIICSRGGHLMKSANLIFFVEISFQCYGTAGLRNGTSLNET